MIADSTVIKFACAHCGQRISVDAAGAGMTATCPNCSQPLVVPKLGSLHHRTYGEDVTSAPSRSGGGAALETNAAVVLRELREKLAETECERGVAEEKLTAEQSVRAAAETQRNLRAGQCLLLQEEIARLRNDLAEGHAGRELLALRDRFEVLESKHQKATAALANLESAHATLTAAERQLRTEASAARARAAATVVTGGFRFGITMARPKRRAVSATTALRARSSRRWRCQSSGRISVIASGVEPPAPR